MAKAKRERRTSIRNMPPDKVLSALEDLERAERAERERPTEAAADRPSGAPPPKEKDV